MRVSRLLSLSALLAAAVAWSAAGPAAADDNKPNKKQQQEKKQQLQEKKQQLLKKLQKQQAEAKEAALKAEAAKKAEEAKKAETSAYAKKNASPPAEPLVPKAIGNGKDAPAVARLIDAEVSRVLSDNKITPSPVCTDAEFLRRAYLDITGVIPPADKAKAFLDGTAPDKRAKLIDELLADPNFGRRQADIWTAVLVQKTSDNRRVDFGSFHGWLKDQFNGNKPWDKVATDVLTAAGPQDKNPAVGFYLGNNTVDRMTDEVCKAFLGVQLQCAQCHNHPFTGWQQTEYWAMAQFFYKVRVTGLNTNRGQMPTVEETNAPRRGKKMELPESAKDVAPKFLQAAEPKLAAADPLRPALARWMTAASNPFFSKAMVNRTWSEFFGVGFVNPVDDMREGNDPSHPELLHALAADFAASGFDLKHLVRSVCLSQTYQRSGKPTAGNDKDDTFFSHMRMKVLTPEQLYDSLTAVTGFERLAGEKGKKEKAGPYQPGLRDRFVLFFLAGADAPNTVEYEAGIPQALRLMNNRLTNSPAALRGIVGIAPRPAEAVERLYLAALSRRPTPDETKTALAHVAAVGNPAEGFGDVLWALVNSSEFTFNR